MAHDFYLNAPKRFYLLRTSDGRYYNGRAGSWESNLTSEKNKAFEYGSKIVADARCTLFNRYHAIHGLTFEVVSC